MPLLPTKQAKKPAATPPSARPLPAGVQGTPPLPQGKLVSARMPSSLTEAERTQMEAIGWTADMPIPSNMAELVAEVTKARSEEALSPPIDPRTPKLATPITDVAALPPEEQQRVRQKIQEMVADEERQIASKAEQAKVEAANARVPGIAQGMAAAQKATELVDEVVLDDRTPAPEPAQTGIDRPAMSHCPHCKWDLSMPDIAEPPPAERLAFLHAMLGVKPYVQERSLFGGNVRLIFRTLTARELDVIYQQVYAEQLAGTFKSDVDYWERANRYRLFLQLLRFEPRGGKLFEAPDGYSAAANPGAKQFWIEPGQEIEGETYLPEIEKMLVDDVLKTDAIFRVVNSDCNNFNRMVIKMEGMADNSDFWQQTEAPS